MLTWRARWLLLAGLGMLAFPGPGLAEEKARRPNVILLLTDDQGYGDLACHGNPVLKTPSLDALHAQSVRLTNFHVDPTCSPTRSALMTGRYSSRTGVWHTIAGRSILRRDETTLADLFARAGYRTGIFGKWHLGDSYPYRPQDRGFHESVVHGGGGVGQTPDFWGNSYFNDTYFVNGVPRAFKGYCTDVFFAEAERFLRASKDKPFFCYLATNVAHAPYKVAQKYARPYRDAGVPEQRANFYGMIANIDENVGKLLALLRELKLEEDTVLLFMTDNGTAAGYDLKAGGFNAGMRGVKGSEYEGGHRVPCFVRWPGKLSAGKDVPELAAHLDILPTLLDLCGIDRPTGLTLDGRSLRPLLEGKGGWKERTLLVHSQRVEDPVKWKQCAVMTQRWRLVNGTELYDMEVDRGQKADVAGKHPEVVKELRGAYEGWWKDISKRFGEYVPLVLGSAHENPTLLTAHDWHSAQVPWDQSMVRKMPYANGFWAVEVERAGRYRFTLRHRPAVAKFPLEAVKARVKLGEQEVVKEVAAGATGVDLELDLKPGQGKLWTELEEKGGKSRGAFYAEVRRLP